MTIQTPKTLTDFIAIRNSITSLKLNKHSDQSMIDSLELKLIECNNKIDELKKTTNEEGQFDMFQ